MIEIIFNFGSDRTTDGTLPNNSHKLPSCFISGFNTKSIHVLSPDHKSFFGVRFHPASLKQILNTPLREFTNRVIDLSLIDPLFTSLWSSLIEKNTFEERVAEVSGWLTKKMVAITPREKVLNDFLTSPQLSILGVSQLAAALGYSTRHLTRKIYELTDMNAEEAFIYRKYLHAIHLIHKTTLTLTDIGYQSQFSDQSHFIRCFKTFTGMTPGDYRKMKSHLPGHIFQHVR